MDPGECYAILGVTQDASEDDIKKAYRKLALQWHPDRNPTNSQEAELMFKRVAEAYSILSDPVKRRQYDLGEPSNLQRNSQHHAGYPWPQERFSRMRAHDIFSQFFGGADPFANMFGMSNSGIPNGFEHHGFAGSSTRTTMHISGGERVITTTTTNTRSDGTQQVRTERVVEHGDGRREVIGSDGTQPTDQSQLTYDDHTDFDAQMQAAMRASLEGAAAQPTSACEWAVEHQELEEMGFADRNLRHHALDVSDGNIEQAIDWLLAHATD